MNNTRTLGKDFWRMVVKSSLILPILWICIFLVSLLFPGGHPPLSGMVLALPVSLSLSARAIYWLTGQGYGYVISLSLGVVFTSVELAFIGAALGVAAKSFKNRSIRAAIISVVCLTAYAMFHVFGVYLFSSRFMTYTVISGPSNSLRHATVERVVRERDQQYINLFFSQLEKSPTLPMDGDMVRAITALEHGELWLQYLTSSRGSHWGIEAWAKIICDISKQSTQLQGESGVDFYLLSESFAKLNDLLSDRMIAALDSRPELIKPIFYIAFNNPTLGRTRIDKLLRVLEHPVVGECPRIPFPFRKEWQNLSHPKHRLYEMARSRCKHFTREDLELWFSHFEERRHSSSKPLEAFGLCQYVIDSARLRSNRQK